MLKFWKFLYLLFCRKLNAQLYLSLNHLHSDRYIAEYSRVVIYVSFSVKLNSNAVIINFFKRKIWSVKFKNTVCKIYRFFTDPHNEKKKDQCNKEKQRTSEFIWQIIQHLETQIT